ncbi:glutamine amidotransferase-related protein, partial [Kitasatospora sp. NPDC004240]
VREVYGGEPYVEERHRHRYEVNNAYRADLEKAGLVFSGLSPKGDLVEYVEYSRETHPYLVATQAHPELKSRPTRPHPLFAGLVRAAIDVRTAAAAAAGAVVTGPDLAGPALVPAAEPVSIP